jgi:hypothetical protein
MAASKKTVNAKWVGPYVAELADGTTLIPGETTAAIPAHQAENDPNWQPVGGKPPKGDS